KAVNGQGASQNEVEGVYTGFTVTGFTDRTDAQNQGVNTEHTFPQSFYNSNLPMRADIHHLFITEGGANSSRSNLPFGVVNNADWQVGGSKRGGGQFEPRDVQKGPTARAMMYFVTRYQDYSSFFAGQETILRQWAADFPPTVAEEARNDATQTVQGNRNPFIDYPQFLERITNLVGTTAEPDLSSVFIPQASVQFGVVGQMAIEPFNWVIMNDGNRTVSLDNFAVGTSVYAIENPPSGPVDLEPGEDLTLRILMDSTISLGGLRLDTLTFTTDLAAMPEITVPIAGEVVASVTGPSRAPNWSMYPNPASGNVTIAWPDAASRQLRLVDVAGRTHWEGQTQRDRFQLTTTGFAPGAYWLEVNGPDGRSVRQLLLAGE
ncbi:MAG: endonuclease, partial [Bacteroidota bacterium]